MTPLRWLYALFLRWSIWEAESYLRDCARDGLIQSLAISEFRRQIAADRVRLYALHKTTAARKAARTARRSWLRSLIGA